MEGFPEQQLSGTQGLEWKKSSTEPASGAVAMKVTAENQMTRLAIHSKHTSVSTLSLVRDSNVLNESLFLSV